MPSYELQTNAPPSKLLFFDSQDGIYNSFTGDGDPYTSDVSFNFKSALQLDHHIDTLISVDQVSIPFSFYLIRKDENDTIKIRMSKYSQRFIGPHQDYLLKFPAGNYSAVQLADQMGVLVLQAMNSLKTGGLTSLFGDYIMAPRILSFDFKDKLLYSFYTEEYHPPGYEGGYQTPDINIQFMCAPGEGSTMTSEIGLKPNNDQFFAYTPGKEPSPLPPAPIELSLVFSGNDLIISKDATYTVSAEPNDTANTYTFTAEFWDSATSISAVTHMDNVNVSTFVFKYETTPDKAEFIKYSCTATNGNRTGTATLTIPISKPTPVKFGMTMYLEIDTGVQDIRPVYQPNTFANVVTETSGYLRTFYKFNLNNFNKAPGASNEYDTPLLTIDKNNNAIFRHRIDMENVTDWNNPNAVLEKIQAELDKCPYNNSNTTFNTDVYDFDWPEPTRLSFYPAPMQVVAYDANTKQFLFKSAWNYRIACYSMDNEENLEAGEVIAELLNIGNPTDATRVMTPELVAQSAATEDIYTSNGYYPNGYGSTNAPKVAGQFWLGKTGLQPQHPVASAYGLFNSVEAKIIGNPPSDFDAYPGMLSPNAVDLRSSIHSVAIKSNLTSTACMSSVASNYTDILIRVPIDAKVGEMINYTGSHAFQPLTKFQDIKEISFQLTDGRGRILDLNGAHWQIAIMLSFVYQQKAIPPLSKEEKSFIGHHEDRPRLKKLIEYAEQQKSRPVVYIRRKLKKKTKHGARKNSKSGSKTRAGSRPLGRSHSKTSVENRNDNSQTNDKHSS